MLTQYKNIDEILAATGSIDGARYTAEKLALLEPGYDRKTWSSVTGSITAELHVYANDAWITGNHTVAERYKTSYKNPKTGVTTNNVTGDNRFLYEIDIYNELANLKLTSGKFRIVVNLFTNLLGSYDEQFLSLSEISPDRTELKLRVSDPTNVAYIQQLTAFLAAKQDYQQTNAPTELNGTIPYYSRYWHPVLLLNFSRNKILKFINWVVVNDFIYVKLQDALPADFNIDQKCWISYERRSPYIDNVLVSVQADQITYNQLASPNWFANYSYDTSAETTFKTWNDLLGSTVSTSQQIVDAYFSGSLAGMKLNVDYRDFNNFVFYSSATQRVSNFLTKLQSIEYYASQSAVVSSMLGVAAYSQSLELANSKTNIISNFDEFEKFLYYESSSKLTTYDIPLENPNVATVTGSYITPVPKTNSTRPYSLYSTTSSIFTTWYNNLYETASLYDLDNFNALINAIPEYIRYDAFNEQLPSFVNMLGHHYDILYTYINHMSRINKREENPKLGMPGELLYSVAKQFGWNLTNGNQYQDLWQYILGTDAAGTPLTGSNTVGDPSVAGQQMTHAVWRRIVNNLPLLLKSKGTKRSVQALLACYGIPETLISINEYGGPRINRTPVYQKLNFDYALDLLKNPSGSVKVNYTKPIQSVELRFRLDNVLTNPTMSSKMNLYTIGSNTVDIDFVSGTKGKLSINGTGSGNIAIFDGTWTSTLLRVTGSQLQLLAKQSKYGKIVNTVSASATASFASTGTLTLGSSSIGYGRLQGQLQELRLWTSSLQDAPFTNHTKAPAAYDGNTDAYGELVFRLPLTQKINHTTTSSLTGVQPDVSAISASFAAWSTATPYDSIEETYYYDAISAGAGVLDDNKVRLEDITLISALDVRQRATRAKYDTQPIDSKRLGVYFSPQTMINEDIIAHLGAVTLDEYIGDPNDGRTPVFDNNPLGQPAVNMVDPYPADAIAANAVVQGALNVANPNERAYPELVRYSKTYWKKYLERNDMNAYINMFTLYDLSFFKQLEQLLPARANKTTGILIQPNILERSKDTVLPSISRQVRHWNMGTTVIDMQPGAMSGEVFDTTYSGFITRPIALNESSAHVNILAYITGSETSAYRYGGFEYSRAYLIQSGSTDITASSPYWISEALLPVITGSTVNKFLLKTEMINGTASLIPSDVSMILSAGVENHRYNGSRMSSVDFNISSADTYDKGPVVEIIEVDGNQLYYDSTRGQGNLFVN